MKKINYTNILISLTLPFLLVSCASTSITGTWKEASYNTPIKKILVIGLSKNATNRRIFEDTLSQDFRDEGKKAVTSVHYFSDYKKINKLSLKPIVRKENIDTVIVARVVHIGKENQYIPSSYPASYNSFDNYYGRISPYYKDQGYYVSNTTVSLEINMYETQTAKLIWAITTETFEPKNINKEIKILSAIIIKELKKDNLL